MNLHLIMPSHIRSREWMQLWWELNHKIKFIHVWSPQNNSLSATFTDIDTLTDFKKRYDL